MNFSEALILIKEGIALTRAGWNGKGQHVVLQTPDANSKMTLPYIFIAMPGLEGSEKGRTVPWLASQTDLLAEDWEMVDGLVKQI